MRHRVAHRKLGRVTEHRLSLLRNQASALIRHERIRTTVPKAKDLRPFVERLITVAKRGLAAGGDVNSLNARRLVLRDIQDRAVVGKLFDTIAPRFQERPGGYTRILRLGHRRGDGADLAQIELVGSEFDPHATTATPQVEAEAPAQAKRSGVGRRLKAAADRLRGKSASADDADTSAAGSATKKPAVRKKAAGRKTARKKS